MNKKQWRIFAAAFFILGIIFFRNALTSSDAFSIENVIMTFLGMAFALWYVGNAEEDKKK